MRLFAFYKSYLHTSYNNYCKYAKESGLEPLPYPLFQTMAQGCVYLPKQEFKDYMLQLTRQYREEMDK